MNSCNVWRLGTYFLMGLCPIMAWADDPTTRPSEPPASQMLGDQRVPMERSDRPNGFDGGGRMGFGRFRGEFPGRTEWEEISTFMKEHSPARFNVITNLSDVPRKFNLMVVAARAYRNVQRVQGDDPELAKIMVTAIELDDRVFDLVSQYRQARRAGDYSHEAALRQELQGKIGELIDTNLKERKLRVERLARTLKQQQDQLAADERNREQLVQKRVSAFLDGQRLEPTTEPAVNASIRPDNAVPSRP